jgi:tetratricopeptide (TPR) repeat protein
MRRVPVFALVIAAFAIAGLASPAGAQNLKACTHKPLAIKACDRLLAGGKLTAGQRELVLVTRGTWHLYMDSYDKALADFDEVIRGNTAYREAYAERGRIMVSKKNYTQALADLNKAAALPSRPKADGILFGEENPWIYYYRAQANTGLANIDAAILDYTEFVSGHRVPKALAERAELYALKGDLDRSIADKREAESKGENNESNREHFEALYAKLRSKWDAEAALARQERPAAPIASTAPIPDQPTAAPAALPSSERRVALVIGNSGYANAARLTNPKADAELIAGSLQRAGFSRVELGLDLGRDTLLDALKAFAAQADTADWAVIYFAGHGLEIGGTNFLVPTDAKLASDRDIPYEAIALEQVLHAVGGAKKLKLVVLDACRDNPFAKTMTRSASATRSIGRGLAPVEDSGTLVAYAAKHGQVALDGEGANSPFAAALARSIESPGLEISMLLRKVRDDVLNATGKRQEPFQYGSLPSEAFYFRKP